MKLLALLGKDARILLRNRALLVALLLYPFVLAGVLGAAFQEAPATLDLVIVDNDGSTLTIGAENLTSRDILASAGAFARIRTAASLDDALVPLRQGEVDAVILIPPHFLSNLSTLGRNATLRVIVDESDPIRAGVAKNAVEGAMEAFVKRIIQKKIDEIGLILDSVTGGGNVRIGLLDINVIGIEEARRRLGEVIARLEPGSSERQQAESVDQFMFTTRLALDNADTYVSTTAMPLRVESTGLAGKDTRLSTIALPGALVLGVFWTGALAAALLVARERELGTLARLRATRTPRIMTAASKTLVALVAALVPAAILVFLGMAALDARPADPLLTGLVLVMASLAAAALGGLCAAIARGTSGATLLAVLALLPMLLLGGLFYPVAYMPAVAQAIARVLPVTLATDALRGALIRGSPMMELALPLVGLAAFALVAGGLAALATRRDA